MPQEFAVIIERPTSSSGSAAHPVDSHAVDTALHLLADGRCLRRNVVQARDPDAIAFKHVYESRHGAWYKTRLRFASLVSLVASFHHLSEQRREYRWDDDLTVLVLRIWPRARMEKHAAQQS